MKCLSCKQALTEKAVFFRNKIVLCGMCAEMAEKAVSDLHEYLRAASEAAFLCLEESILNGGLLRGGSGMENNGSDQYVG